MGRIWLTNMKSVEGGILCDIAFRVSSGKNAVVDRVVMARASLEGPLVGTWISPSVYVSLHNLLETGQ